METTYTIEFMRLAEPPLAPIKHPSAFHVAYYCNPRAPLMNLSEMGKSPTFTMVRDSLPPWPVHCLREFKAVGKKKGGRRDNSLLERVAAVAEGFSCHA